MEKIIVGKHPQTGLAVNPARHNADFVTVLLQEQGFKVEGTFVGLEKKSCFQTMHKDTLVAFEAKFGKLEPGKPYPIAGKLVVTETTDKAAENQQPKINPTTQKVITCGGKLVYRNTAFTTNMNAQDTYLPMDREVVDGEKQGAPAATNFNMSV